MKKLTKVALGLVACGAIAAPLLAQDGKGGFKKDTEIALDGDPFFDYLVVDSAAKRLYVAHTPNVDVVDLEKGTRVGVIEKVNGAHGIVLVPDQNRGFATAGKRNKMVTFDLANLKPGKEVATGGNPDAVLYVTSAKEVWAFNGKGGDVTCVDASSLETKATIKLAGKPEFAVEWPEKGLVFVNIEDKHGLCALDIKKHEVVGGVHSLDPGKEPTGLAIDVKNGLLFAGCTDKLVVLDAASFKVVTALDIGEGCDAVAFDPGTGNVFVSCGGAAKTYVFHVEDAKTVKARDPIETVESARTCTVDPVTHKLYVCSGKKGGKGIKVLVFSPAS